MRLPTRAQFWLATFYAIGLCQGLAICRFDLPLVVVFVTGIVIGSSIVMVAALLDGDDP